MVAGFAPDSAGEGLATPQTRQLGRARLRLTSLGFGGGPVGWRDTADVEEEAQSLLGSAWAAGVRYFDTAPYYGYGDSERRLGRFLTGQKRNDFVLSTKVGRLIRPRFSGDRSPEKIVFDYSRDGSLRSIEESLQRLGLERVDIVLIHDIDRYTHKERQPQRFREALGGAYRALADLKEQGVVRAIGLGVNEWQVCRDFARQVPIDCFLLAGRHTLLEQEAQQEYLPEALERGIGVIVGGPYNSGVLASGAVPGALYDYAPAPAWVLERVGRIEAVCARFGVPLQAAALAFPFLHPAVTTVIPGMATVEELGKTLNLAGAAVPDELWATLAGEGLVVLPTIHEQRHG